MFWHMTDKFTICSLAAKGLVSGLCFGKDLIFTRLETEKLTVIASSALQG